jgi:hypothetical protein
VSIIDIVPISVIAYASLPSGDKATRLDSSGMRIVCSMALVAVSILDNILTIPRQRLKRLMGACDAPKVEERNQAIKAALDVR